MKFKLEIFNNKFLQIFAFSLMLIFLSTPAFALDLIMFHSDSCYACERWEDEVGVKYPLTNEAKRAPLKREDAFEIPEKYELKADIHFTPTFVLTENNKEISRIVGYTQEDFFWFFLDEELNKIQ